MTTFNPSAKTSVVVLSNGNLTAASDTTSQWESVQATTFKSSGKWYCEFTVNQAVFDIALGIETSTDSTAAGQFPGGAADSWAYWSNGSWYNNGASTGGWATYTTGDVIGMALDATGGTLSFYKNGVLQGTISGVSAGSYTPAVGFFYSAGSAGQVTANFGATSFAYTVPSSYSAYDAPAGSTGTGTPSFADLIGAGAGLVAGVGTMSYLAGVASGNPGAGVSFLPLTGGGTSVAAGAIVAFQDMTAAGTLVVGVANVSGTTVFQAMLGGGVVAPNYAASGGGLLLPMTAWGSGPDVAATEFADMAGGGTVAVGTVLTGVPRFLSLQGGGGVAVPGDLAGDPSFQYLLGGGAMVSGGLGAGVGALLLTSGAGVALVGVAAVGAPAFEELVAAAAGSPVGLAYGGGVMPLQVGYGLVFPVGGSVMTWVMNTRTNAVTEYEGYTFNSFARYNGMYLGAGPSGLYQLESGETDNGAAIAWDVKTGGLDNKFVGLKRLIEVLLSMRYDGPIRVTVWKDENTSYAYPMANYQPDYSLHQWRVKTGKGLRSRYFQVELSGSGTKAEIGSMVLTMPPTTRRVG